LAEHEQYVYGWEDEQDIKSFYKKTYNVMRKTASLYNDTAFHDVSTIFADVRESIYVDWFHLNEYGKGVTLILTRDSLPVFAQGNDFPRQRY
jgi:hypothetical protein